jgi:hypothetical protein
VAVALVCALVVAPPTVSDDAAQTAKVDDSVWAALMFAEAGAVLGTEGAESSVWWSRPVERDAAVLAAWRRGLLAVAAGC